MIDLINDNSAPTREQINKRVVAKIRQQYSDDDEKKLTRISLDLLLNKATLAPEDVIHLDKYKKHVLESKAWGTKTKADAKLLQDALDYEAAQERLKQPIVKARKAQKEVLNKDGTIKTPAIEAIPAKIDDGTGTMIPNPVIVKDKEERAAAQAVIDNATPETVKLVTDREAARAVV